MANLFKIRINTPGGILLEDNIILAEINTTEGKYAIMADHTPIIGAFKAGHLYIRDERNNRDDTIINYGAFRFDQNILDIFTDFFAFANKIDDQVLLERQKVIDRVINLQQKNNTDKTYETLQFKLKQNMNKLRRLIEGETK